MKYSGFSNPFSVKGSNTAVINGDTIAAIGDFSASKDEAIKFMVLSFHLSNLEFSYNTLEHDYDMGMMVKTSKLVPKIGKNSNPEDAEYGFDIGIKGGKWDSINIHADFPITVVATPPVSLSDFTLGVSGMSTADQGKGFLNTLGNITFKGSTDISVLKLSDIIDSLDAIFGDVSLVTLDDTSASIRFSNFMLQFDTTLKLFGALDIGKTQLNIGQYEYSNYLLNIETTEASGLRFISSRGFNWDQSNIKLNMNGSVTITMNNYFTGVWANGQLAYDIKFLGRHKDSFNGNALVGLHNGAKQFTILLKASELGSNKEDGVRLTFSEGKWLPKAKFY